MTFSIVAHDAGAGEWGVAVASKYLAAGSVVPFAAADVGAVATQALVNVAYGRDGLALLADGADAERVVAALTDADEDAAHRQVGVVDGTGRAATYTGSECLYWAGGRTGPGYACQGNILVGPEVVDAMADAFTAAEGDLASRLVDALRAGDLAGGDARGRQSAGLLVVGSGDGHLESSDVVVDLRVDDHLDPVLELVRLLAIHRHLYPRAEDLEFVDVDAALAGEIARLLDVRGSLAAPHADGAGYDDDLRRSLFAWVATENLEGRWVDDDRIEEAVLMALRAGR
ncbi:MAG TPA: DUF1028 domain-containing protein [Acidimicrobiia bacterium]